LIYRIKVKIPYKEMFETTLADMTPRRKVGPIWAAKSPIVESSKKITR